MGRVLARIAALAFAGALGLGAAPGTPGPASAAEVAKIPLRPTRGDSLSAADSAAVTRTLLDYLGAMKAKDFVRAAAFLDSASFVASADSMVAQAANDSTPAPAIRGAMFGVETPEALHAQPVARTFAALMAATEAASPGALDAVARADVDVLAARRLDDHVVVAYQLTVQPAEPDGQPLTHVTAEKLRFDGGRWRILFQP